MKNIKCELYNDNFQNFKRYGIPKAQLVIADIPYNIGTDAYGSSPEWYIGGDRRNGESRKAGRTFFHTDVNFNIAEYFHFCNRLLKKEPKQRGQAPAMLVFCSFQQMQTVIRYGEKYGFLHNIPLVFNWFPYERDGTNIPKIHATQKPVKLLKRLIEIFTDPSDVVIDPCAGSGSTLRAAYETGRHSYGFEISKQFCRDAKEKMLVGMLKYEPEIAQQERWF